MPVLRSDAADEDVLNVDHIIAVSDGGGNEDTNLVTSCFDCNAGKSDKPLEVIPEALQAQLEERTLRLEQMREYNEMLLEERRYIDEAVRRVSARWYDQISEPGTYSFNPQCQTSIRMFLEKLPEVDVLDAVDIAIDRIKPELNHDRDAFKYFCGICWSKIRANSGKSADRGVPFNPPSN